jgi:hypothetical protein
MVDRRYEMRMQMADGREHTRIRRLTTVILFVIQQIHHRLAGLSAHISAHTRFERRKQFAPLHLLHQENN